MSVPTCVAGWRIPCGTRGFNSSSDAVVVASGSATGRTESLRLGMQGSRTSDGTDAADAAEHLESFARENRPRRMAWVLTLAPSKRTQCLLRGLVLLEVGWAVRPSNSRLHRRELS